MLVAAELMGDLLESIDICTANSGEVFGDGGNIPIPPADAEEGVDGAVVKALADGCGWVAADDRIGFHIAGDNRLAGDDRPVTDLDSWHDGGIVANPNIVADDGISFVGPAFWHCLLPSVAKHRERIGSEPISAVVAAVHDEGSFCCDRAKLTDDQPIALEVEMVENVALKAFGVFGVVIVGVVTDDDHGVGHHIFQVNQARLSP